MTCISASNIIISLADQFTSMERHSIGKYATVQSGKTIDFYANPDMIYFRVTLTTSQASCKPVNSGQWVKKLQKQKNDAECLNVDLDFSGGRYCASLRLSLGKRGILEVVIFILKSVSFLVAFSYKNSFWLVQAAVFTSYILKNDSGYPLFFFPPDQKPLSRYKLFKISFNLVMAIYI